MKSESSWLRERNDVVGDAQLKYQSILQRARITKYVHNYESGRLEGSEEKVLYSTRSTPVAINGAGNVAIKFVVDLVSHSVITRLVGFTRIRFGSFITKPERDQRITAKARTRDVDKRC